MCQVTVGVLGDVCRAIEEQIAPYTENIMRILLRNLESNDVQRNIKPQILSAFGDMALAIGDRFEVCLPPCLHMLQSAQVRHPFSCLSMAPDVLSLLTVTQRVLTTLTLALPVSKFTVGVGADNPWQNTCSKCFVVLVMLSLSTL